MMEIVQMQKDFFNSGKTRDYSVRIKRLQQLREAIQRYEPDILTALRKDLNKSEKEAYITEIGFLLEEIKHTMKNLKKWMAPQKTKTPLTLVGSKSYIYAEPYGVSLIISPWNYPFQLAMAPLVGTIAAGNCAVIKPSEYTPNTSKMMIQMLEGIFEKEFVAMVEGGVEVSTALLQEPFDYIFFTGSVSVGKIVMETAAKTLTPVTLELGGKSPAIVAEDANLDLAAKRLVWGKFVNAGQSCVAPDYLYVHKDVKEELLVKIKQAITSFYGEKPLENPDYVRIISEKHFQRLEQFIQDGEILVGGETDAARCVIAPTLLENVSWDSPMMQDEIFGPILPIYTFTQLEDVIQLVRKQPKPLALYFFSENKDLQEKVIQSLSFGGGCINDTLVHLASPYLPFGGVGTSGLGNYHGKFSFDTFSHYKGIVKQTTSFDMSLRYPSSKAGLNAIKKLMK